MEQSNIQVSPLKQANDFANSAEAAAERGDIETSCTLHFRAAELFLLAMNDTKDAEVFYSNKAVKTLKLLYASHTRAGKDLQRRIETPPRHRPIPVVVQPKPTHRYQMKEQVNPRPINPTSSQTDHENSINPGYSNEANVQSFSNQANSINQSYSNQANSIAQSYMILDQKEEDFRHENEDDPFNKFWDAIEGLGIKTSGPVAFTTAPLGDTQVEIQSPIEENSPTNLLQSYMVIPPTKKSNSNYNQDKTNEEYRLENKQLKEMVDLLAKKVAALERTQNENNMLKSSIIQFRQDIQKQRVNNPLMQSINDKRRMPLSQSVMMPSNQNHESDKIKHLEQELQKANIQNELHVKKWEKLKETARKKRELKSSIFTDNVSMASELPPVSPPLGSAALSSSNPVSPLGMSPPSPSHSLYYSMNSRFQ